MSAESIGDRLKRLCRAVPPAPSIESPPRADEGEASAPPPASVADSSTVEQAHDAVPRTDVFERLARRKRSAWIDVRTDLETTPALPPRELSLSPPRDLVAGPRGTHARTTHFERDHAHGSFALSDVFAISLAQLAERARDERLARVDLERALFFDTETTGLSGGAGTYVYLVGLGRFDARQFELWQGFLAHPAEEKALLQEVADRIAAASVLVSFFGKSFDRHRLEDKMRLHGVTPPFATTIHLDLYHPLRRAHKGQFENCRLKTLERELAGVMRADDLPGSFAPAAWFDFLNQRPHQLEGVFRHNQDDVLSLVALATHLAH